MTQDQRLIEDYLPIKAINAETRLNVKGITHASVR